MTDIPATIPPGVRRYLIQCDSAFKFKARVKGDTILIRVYPRDSQEKAGSEQANQTTD